MRQVPPLALLAEFDRILTGEAQYDDTEYHEAAVNAIRAALMAQDHQVRMRDLVRRLRCSECGHGFGFDCDAHGCLTHVAVNLVLNDVFNLGPDKAAIN